MRRYTRLLGTRQQQLDSLRKQDWQIITYKHVPVVVAFHSVAGRMWVKAWCDKANKEAFFYTFPTVTAAEKYVTEFVRKAGETQEWKAKRKAETQARRAGLKASDFWTVGDVLYNSWGYDQTNIDWYQVIEVKPKSIVIQSIKKNYGESGFLSGHSQPRRNEFAGEPMIKPLSETGGISMRHGAATKWEGRPVYESHYA